MRSEVFGARKMSDDTRPSITPPLTKCFETAAMAEPLLHQEWLRATIENSLREAFGFKHTSARAFHVARICGAASRGTLRTAIRRHGVSKRHGPTFDDMVRIVVTGVDRGLKEQLNSKFYDNLVDVRLTQVASTLMGCDFDNAIERLRLTRTYGVVDVGEEPTILRDLLERKKIFSVPWCGREVAPCFQFKDGAPIKSIGEALADLPDDFSPWQVAFWFASSNRWLDGEAPVDRLNDLEAIRQAARMEREAVFG